MEHAEIARRLPTVSHGIKAAVTDVESMVDELARLPAGHERAGQIKQQVHSKLFMATRDLDDMQPDAPKPEPVVSKVENDNHEEKGHGDDAKSDVVSNDGGMKSVDQVADHLRSSIAQFDNDAADNDHQEGYLEALKETLRVVTGDRGESDGSVYVSMSERELRDKPHDEAKRDGDEFGAHGHAGDGPHFGDANVDQHRAVDGDNADLEGTDVTANEVEGHAGGDPADAMHQADATGEVKGASSFTPNDAHHTPGQDKADA